MHNAAAVQAASSVEEAFRLMHKSLGRIVPEFELRMKAEIAFRINRLKREKNAIILGHNYMEPALYNSVPDHVGDSLGLARISARSDADIIIFCGVRFMAETAKILNPDRTVLLPAREAGCSLAASITGADVRRLKEEFPGVPVVTYVNCYADVKAETDVCCTSGNATAVARHLFAQGHRAILFLPDAYLTQNVAAEVGAKVVFPRLLGGPGADAIGPDDRVLISWKGTCEVHEQFSVEDVETVRKQFPDTVVLAHPECKREVVEKCDYSGSTSGMVKYVRDVDAPRYLLLTECSMGDNIVAENPHRELLRLCSHRCPHMNQITLEDTLDALEHNRYEIHLDPALMDRARASLDRMLTIG
ncbi:MAG: quinolinate synthase NadA [Planctomycetes bacterium]|nr:quinolinate synthase NadA [Planctomycetota bacterium]